MSVASDNGRIPMAPAPLNQLRPDGEAFYQSINQNMNAIASQEKYRSAAQIQSFPRIDAQTVANWPISYIEVITIKSLLSQLLQLF